GFWQKLLVIWHVNLDTVTHTIEKGPSLITADDEKYLALALQEAQAGWGEGGVPIGAALIHEGKVLAPGRNRRVHNDSAILHAETDSPRAASGEPRHCQIHADGRRGLGVPVAVGRGPDATALITRRINGRSDIWLGDVGQRTCARRPAMIGSMQILIRSSR